MHSLQGFASAPKRLFATLTLPKFVLDHVFYAVVLQQRFRQIFSLR